MKTDMLEFMMFYNNLSNDEKTAFIYEIISGRNALSSDEMGRVSRMSCPFCSSETLVKNGRSSGRQRYLCRSCRKTFIGTSGRGTYYSHYDLPVWKEYINCMANSLSIRRSAEVCGIALYTSFKWRHKILETMGAWQKRARGKA